MNDNLVFSAEQAFLGSCLNDPMCVVKGGAFGREHWSDSRHAMIYTAIGQALKRRKTCFPLEVAEELGDFREKYYPYLVELAENCPCPANFTTYADIIREHTKLRLSSRRIQAALNDIAEQAGTVEELLSSLKKAVSETNTILASKQGFKSFRESLDLAILDRARKRDRSGVPSTIGGLDVITGGFGGPTLTVIGARTNVGKSIVAGQIAINAAVRHRRPVGIISLEMGAGQIMSRMLTYLYGDEPDLPEDAPLYIDDTSRDLDAVLYRIREWHVMYGIELCIIDHIQIIHAPGFRQRYEQVGEISRALKALAMELNLPLLVLAQLSRAHVRDKRRPNLSDLRECGSIEQDADNVFLLHCNQARGKLIELSIEKHRDGPSGGVIDLQFYKARLCLKELLPGGRCSPYVNP